MHGWQALLRRSAILKEQLRRLRWLALWLIARYSLHVWLSGLISSEAKR